MAKKKLVSDSFIVQCVIENFGSLSIKREKERDRESEREYEMIDEDKTIKNNWATKTDKSIRLLQTMKTLNK